MEKVICKTCKKEFLKYPNDIKKTKHNFCSRQCFYKSPERSPNLGKKGKYSSGWKGGCLYERGYKMVIAQNHPKAVSKGGGLKYIREHRLIMENHIGRYLEDNEVVHHINGDISDNRIENLSLMEHGDHSRLHINRYWKSKLAQSKI